VGSLAVVSLALPALLLSLTVGAARAADSTLDEIYAALRPQNLRTEGGVTQFAPGATVAFTYDLVNTSDQTLFIPLTTPWTGFTGRIVGTEQTWLERLGPDPTIPGPWADGRGRKGTWYAAGGLVLTLEADAIQPHQRITRSLPPITGTADFPNGRYRYHVEYKPVGGGLDDVIAAVTIDVTFVRPPADLALAKSHEGNLVRGREGTYRLVVRIIGAGPSTGAVSVTDWLPAGVPPVLVTAPGWTCSQTSITVTCTRADSLGPTAAYPAILISVRPGPTAARWFLNVAWLAGGGDPNALNNVALDPTFVM
jgi:hypothetical protein